MHCTLPINLIGAEVYLCTYFLWSNPCGATNVGEDDEQIYRRKAQVPLYLTCTLLKLDAQVSFWPMSSQVSEVCYSKPDGRVFGNARRGAPSMIGI